MAFTETRLDKILGTGSGTASRPAFGNAGARWIDTTGPTETYDTGAAWVALGGAAGSLTASSNKLASDVVMSVANTPYDGPSLSLAAGSYLLIGTLTLLSSGTLDFTIKLWDGTTTIATTEGANPFATYTVSLSVSGIVVLGSTTTIKITALSPGTTGTIKAAAVNNAAGNTASTLTALKYA